MGQNAPKHGAAVTGRRPWRWLLATAVLLLIGSAAALLFAMSTAPRIDVTGLQEDTSIQELESGQVVFAVEGMDPADTEILLDGEPAPVHQQDDRLVLDPPELPEGEHDIIVDEPGVLPFLPDQTTELAFTIDRTPPELDLEPVGPLEPHEPGELRGTVHGAETVIVGDEVIPVGDDGGFTASIPAGQDTLTVSAGDAAGNTTSRSLPLRHPDMRAVHMTASSWSDDALRESVLQMIREGRIDTVQLDIKDESGQIGYSSEVPLAEEIDANSGLYNARQALDQLHDEDVRVVGRLVAFLDPVLGEASWRDGHHDRVVQNSDGTAWTGDYSDYGEYAFTNLADPEVRSYNIALAEEAAELGFDDVLYDYVRRPDGALDQMRFPGLADSPGDAVVSFLAESEDAIHPHGAFQGASVFGIAASRPEQIAQDVPAMSEHTDYIAPMVYPSHWGSGEYGVDDPERQPYEITARSLSDFADAAAQGAQGKDTQVVPWLQAFSQSVDYGPEQIREQVRAAEDNGMNSFLLWNAGSHYDADALDPT